MLLMAVIVSGVYLWAVTDDLFFNYHVHTKRNYKPLTRGAKGANSCEL